MPEPIETRAIRSTTLPYSRAHCSANRASRPLLTIRNPIEADLIFALHCVSSWDGPVPPETEPRVRYSANLVVSKPGLDCDSAPDSRAALVFGANVSNHIVLYSDAAVERRGRVTASCRPSPSESEPNTEQRDGPHRLLSHTHVLGQGGLMPRTARSSSDWRSSDWEPGGLRQGAPRQPPHSEHCGQGEALPI